VLDERYSFTSGSDETYYPDSDATSLHKWLWWDILPWLWPNQPSQVALIRHITLTLTQPVFTSGSDKTSYPDSDLTSLLGQSQGNMSHQSHLWRLVGSESGETYYPDSYLTSLHKWLWWDILPWLWPNQPSQVALMRHITLTLTQPAFTIGSNETYYPDSDPTSLHKWLRWDILPWLLPNQPSQVALMRRITLTLTQPAFTSGSDETYYPDSDPTSLHKWLW
jgi:hypothetical protein